MGGVNQGVKAEFFDVEKTGILRGISQDVLTDQVLRFLSVRDIITLSAVNRSYMYMLIRSPTALSLWQDLWQDRMLVHQSREYIHNDHVVYNQTTHTKPPRCDPNTVKGMIRLFAQGVINVPAAADTFVFYSQNDRDRPAYTTTEIKAYQHNENRNILIRFDAVSQLSAFSRIKCVKLRMYKKWDGDEHGWYGSDQYCFHFISNYERDVGDGSKLFDENTTRSVVPERIDAVPHIIRYISPRTHVWQDVDITELVLNIMTWKKQVKNRDASISMEITGADHGSLSAFSALEEGEHIPHIAIYGSL